MDVGLVCDSCSALTPIGVPQCTRCGAAVALDPRAAKQRSTNQGAAAAPNPSDGVVGRDDQACPKCQAIVAGGHKFCHSCGARMPEPFAFEETQIRPMHSSPGRSTMFFGAVQTARARLTLIRGDGEDGVSFMLAGEEHIAGRGDCAISFPDDSFLSPSHANFIYRDAQLIVRDLESLNGVYVRITGSVEIAAGTRFLIGEQVLSVHVARHHNDVPEPDGTYFSASMPRSATFEVVQHLRGGERGRVTRLDSETATVGRENNVINFPEDPFISGRHAEIRKQGSFFTLTDIGSRNGTFCRVEGEQVVRHGDFVFLGQQLLRVEIV
jgi:pSer/pThr/pTyr-binding forkhead associated (FHA) protein/RNA polymerase subunit RPABC4/transcription elongation factor Spt4